MSKYNKSESPETKTTKSFSQWQLEMTGLLEEVYSKFVKMRAEQQELLLKQFDDHIKQFENDWQLQEFFIKLKKIFESIAAEVKNA